MSDMKRSGDSEDGKLKEVQSRLAALENLERKSRTHRRYAHHPAKSDQLARYGTIRDMACALALKIDEMCPQSRELSLAHTKLEEAVMWANKSIAVNEE